MPLPVLPAWAVQVAVLLGKFVGAVLSECAPVLEEIIYRALRKVFIDSAVVGKPVDEFERMRNEDGSPPQGDDVRSSGVGEAESSGWGRKR